jgi:hypothetical protein
MDGIRLVRARWRDGREYLVAELDGQAIAACYVPAGTEVTVAGEKSSVTIRRAADGHLLGKGPIPT